MRLSNLAATEQEPEVLLRVLRINMTQLQAINYHDQTFSARFFINFIIEGGNQQEDLCHDLDGSKGFPETGGRPGAGWYLDQIDFPTARDYIVYQKKIVRLDDKDLHLVVDMCGTFFESMELQEYPLDVQRLTFVLSIRCANEGVVPVVFDPLTLGKAAVTVNLKTFALANMWHLFPNIVVERTKIELMPGRSYPALSISALVARKPFPLLVNVVIPVSGLTFLTGLVFLLPIDDSNRLAFSSTMMLTSAVPVPRFEPRTRGRPPPRPLPCLIEPPPRLPMASRGGL